MNHVRAIFLAAAVWGGIFLPGLGSVELRGEEGRRVMPAVTMLEGGSWLVPHVGGKPFLRKPPLVQWCIAGSLRIFGQNAWAARLPSALSVLALAMVMILATRGWLVAGRSLLAAVIMMVQVATIEKCRLAELEAVYVALSGVAMVLWMSWWTQNRPPWLTWTVPFIFNGLALLAKAPLHLLFFYAVVVATLARAGEIRSLRRMPHLAGLLLMTGIFAAWAVPYFIEVNAGQAGAVWMSESVNRVVGATTSPMKLAGNLVKGLVNHLPWVLFAPLLWRVRIAAGARSGEAALLVGGRMAVAGSFVVLLLIPGMLPRYVQPLVAPFSLLLALVIWEMPEAIRRWWRNGLVGGTAIVAAGVVAAPFVAGAAASRGAEVISAGAAILAVLGVAVGARAVISLRGKLEATVHLALWTGALAAMGMLLYTCAAVPWLRLREKERPFAARIDAAVGKDAPLIAYGLFEDSPLLGTTFYLRMPVRFAADAADAPSGVHVYLVPAYHRAKFEEDFRTIGEPIASQEMARGLDAVVVRAERVW